MTWESHRPPSKACQVAQTDDFTANVGGGLFDLPAGAVNNQYRVRWRTIDDRLIRGTYAKGFRTPNIDDLYGGIGQRFATFLDPCDSAFRTAAPNASVAARCTADGVSAHYRQKDPAGNPITSNAADSRRQPFCPAPMRS